MRPSALRTPRFRAAERPRLASVTQRTAAPGCRCASASISAVPSVLPSSTTTISYNSDARVWSRSARIVSRSTSRLLYVGMMTLISMGPASRPHLAVRIEMGEIVRVEHAGEEDSPEARHAGPVGPADAGFDVGGAHYAEHPLHRVERVVERRELQGEARLERRVLFVEEPRGAGPLRLLGEQPLEAPRRDLFVIVVQSGVPAVDAAEAERAQAEAQVEALPAVGVEHLVEEADLVEVAAPHRGVVGIEIRRREVEQTAADGKRLLVRPREDDRAAADGVRVRLVNRHVRG